MEMVEVGEEAVEFFDHFVEAELQIEEFSEKGVEIINKTENLKHSKTKCSNSRGSTNERLPSEEIVPKEFLDTLAYALVPFVVNAESSKAGGALKATDEEERNACSKKLDERLKLKLTRSFDVDDAKLNHAIKNAAKNPKTFVEISILEAKNLRAKFQVIDSYCIVYIVKRSLLSNSDVKKYETQVAFGTLNPSWNTQFEILGNYENNVIVFEMWYSSKEMVSESSNRRSFRMPKSTKMGDTKILLGYATVFPEDCEKGFDGWLKLVKPKDGQTSIDTTTSCASTVGSKKRGDLHVRIDLRRSTELTKRDQQNFRKLLKTIAHSHQSECFYPWDGSILDSERKMLNNFRKVYDISERDLSRFWWLVMCEEDHISCSFSFWNKLARETLVGKNGKEDNEFEESVIYWMNVQVIRIKDLDSYFPPFHIGSNKQLLDCLSTIRYLEENMRDNLLQKSLRNYTIAISDALKDYLKSWSSKHQELAKRQPYKTDQIQKEGEPPLSEDIKKVGRFSFRRSKTVENQNARDLIILNESVSYIQEVYYFLVNIAKKYDYPFYNFLYLSDKVAFLLGPLLSSRFYSNFSSLEDLTPKANPLALEHGTPVYILYATIKQIELMCRDCAISPDLQLQSGLQGYWRWFSGGMKLYLKRFYLRAQNKMKEEIRDDGLSISPEECKFTFSAERTIEVQKIIIEVWQAVDWPGEDTENHWQVEIGSAIGSLGVFYAEEIRKKLDASVEENIKHKMCFAVNNLSIVSEVLLSVPQLLCRPTQSNCGELQSDSDMKKLQKLVGKAISTINDVEKSFYDQLIQKFSIGFSWNMLNQLPYLEYIQGEMEFHEAYFTEKNFRKFLQSTWTSILKMLKTMTESSKHTMEFTFFSCLYECLEKSSSLIGDEVFGFEKRVTEDYSHLKRLLCCLKMSTENLITSFYVERLQEPTEINGTLVVMATLSERILNIEIILAKDLQPCSSNGGDVLSLYVLLKLVPEFLFPDALSARTKVQKGSSVNVVFNSTFQFRLGEGEDGEFVQLSVYKWRSCWQKDILMGEAFLPLENVDRIPLTETNCENKTFHLPALTPGYAAKPVTQHFLKITKAKNLRDYDSLKFLQLRRCDTTAKKFLKQLNFL